MHVALIVDRGRLEAERAAISRLAVGLMSEGLRVTCVLPEAADEFAAESEEMGLAQTVTAPMRVLPWARADRATRLVSALERQPPDVLHAFGREAWTLGLDLAERLDRPVALDVAEANDIKALPAGRRTECIGAYIVPTGPMADAARETVEPELVCLVPTGVAIPPQARAVLAAEDREPGLSVLGFGLDMPMYAGLLGGLAHLQRTRGDLHVFLELRGRYQHEIWRLAQDLDLMHTVSTFAKATQARALLTDCDVLVVPERVGIMRTVILETMAVGVPVVAGPDPWLDMFIHGRTAMVVADGEPASWAAAMEGVLADPAAARAMGRAGRERIAARHRSTDQIRALSDAYEQMSRGEAIPI